MESGEKRRVKIGTSPLAANAEVRVDPDRLFGRHLAVLGNTGSGKSCSVAGLIQWSLDAAAAKGTGNNPNARFIVLDPNGEYAKVFANKKFKHQARVFQVGDKDKPLEVPLWFWNSAEWCSFTQASAKAQRPLLQETLRAVRNEIYDINRSVDFEIKHFLGIILQTARHSLTSGGTIQGISKYKKFYGTSKGLNASIEEFYKQTPEDSLTILMNCFSTAITSHRIVGKK